MVRVLFWTALSLVTTSSCRPEPLAIRRWLGCYEVTVGSWYRDPLQPARPATLPDTLALTGRLAIASTDTLGYQVEPDLFAAERTRFPPAWRVADDTVRLTWTDGFKGARLWFTPTDSGFWGRAESFTDQVVSEERRDGTRRQIPWPNASVRLRPIRCGSLAAA